MAAKKQNKEATQFLESHPDLEAVDLLMPDLNGILRGKRIEASYLNKIYQDGAFLAESVWATDISGETVEESGMGLCTGEIDAICKPVKNSLKLAPWHNRSLAQCMISMEHAPKKPYIIDPRYILSNLVKGFKAKKLKPVIALELEFYLLPENQHSLKSLDTVSEVNSQVYSIDDLDHYDAFLKAVSSAAEQQEIPISCAVAEYSPGQFEINLEHQDDPVKACDHAILLKRLIKGVAQRHGLRATFMAKPFTEHCGSGTHIHTSLYNQDGENIFYKKNQPNGSKKLSHAIGGLIEILPESMLFYAPGANSYHRFVKNSYVPNAVNWGVNNRSVALRIPASTPDATRIEHRVSGADCNPYLLAISVLAGIDYGLRNKIAPPQAVTGNAYEQDDHPLLPSSWESAIKTFEASTILKEYVGNSFFDVFLAIKKAEHHKFNLQLSPLEFEWYL